VKPPPHWGEIARFASCLSPKDNNASQVGWLETFPRCGDAGTFLAMRSAALQQIN
jgi:hypothetical protein